jgi:hypothetical protein
LEDRTEDFLFNFLDESVDGPGTPFGRAIGLTGSSKPSLTDQGIGQTLFFFQPCAINPPHAHPRGTEMLHVKRGTFMVGFSDENGLARNLFDDELVKISEVTYK